MIFDWQVAGAFAFGALIGWYVYYVNRYRTGDIQIGDVVTLIGAIGGSAVLALFDRKTDLFGAYGVGLAVGFFGYFIVLAVLVKMSSNFDRDWFLDGRRKDPQEGYGYGTNTRPTIAPMAINVLGTPTPTPPPQVAAPGIQFIGVNPGEAAALPAPAEAPRPLELPNAATGRVHTVCASVWAESGPTGPFRNSANGFVIEVAHRLGLTLSGTVDQMVAQAEARGWTRLAGDAEAREAAAQGRFVLAAVKADDYDPPRLHGQAAVVAADPRQARSGLPRGYWGSDSPEVAEAGGMAAPLSRCFPADVRSRIVYLAREM
ncbi:MAG TPA: hypothetical protein VF547_05020 [Allosphingosinicella sp.]|jgi:hypothetical protein